MSNEADNGKAFEFACLTALDRFLSDKKIAVNVIKSDALTTAKGKFYRMSDETKEKFSLAANAAVRVITRLEPQLENSQLNIPLYLSIQSDSMGMDGDVRDVLCVRRQNGWEIGLSCKHNHYAVKHSRLSASIDFGTGWRLGASCSEQYWNEVNPIFERLKYIREESNNTALWRNVENKEESVYKPILEAFMSELKRIRSKCPGMPAALVQYLIGVHDFYKVIANESQRTTRIEAFNISKTLGQPSGRFRPMLNLPKLKLPSDILDIRFKSESQTTVEIYCNEGWSISMRIHSAKSTVEPSLKFDAQLISIPRSIHVEEEPW